MTRILAGLLILMGVCAQAAEPIVVVVPNGATDGCWVVFMKAGVVTVMPGTQGGSVVPGPVVPPVVPPDPITPSDTLTKVVVAEVNKIAASNKRHEVAMKLGKVYEMLAGQTIPPPKAVEATDKIVAVALGNDAAVLSGVCSAVDAALKKATNEAGVSAVLKEAGSALATTIPASGDGGEKAAAEKFGFDWDKFLAFLMQLLQVLLPIILKL